MSSKTYHEKLQHQWFYVQLIHCHGEYTPLIEPVQDKLNANMIFSNLGDHVPEAECNNQTIKECI